MQRMSEIETPSFERRMIGRLLSTAAGSARVRSALLIAGLITFSAAAANTAPDSDIEKIVAAELHRVLPAREPGAAVAVLMQGRTLFFNFGWADRARKQPITQDSLFNLASVGKVFDATL